MVRERRGEREGRKKERDREREREAGCGVIRGRERRSWVKVWQW